MSTTLTALIPAHNDDYALSLCLESIAPYFGEIIVLDDGSIDDTREVVRRAQQSQAHIRLVEHRGQPLGWAEARRRLIALAEGDHLFFMDADDVLCEDKVDLLFDTPRIAPIVYTQVAEMWGDFDHTTQRLAHHDPCHLYVNRAVAGDIDWVIEGNTDYPRFDLSIDRRCGAGPLFWHLKGVKPDWRLVERPAFNRWHEQGKAGNPYDDVLALSEDEIHVQAIDRLLRNDEDRIRRYVADVKRPKVVESATPRFEMIYAGGRCIDRRDHGWWGRRSLNFGADDSVTGWDGVVPTPCREVTARPLEDASWELSTPGGGVLRCNVTAAVVWRLCDGQRDIAAVKREVYAIYGRSRRVERDVMDTLRAYARLRMLRMTTGSKDVVVATVDSSERRG